MMETVEYLDFELRIEKRGQRYLATVVHSPCGEASVIFKLPFSNLEIENFVLRMESTRRGMRRINTPEMETVRQFGNKLFEAVFNDEVRSCFISSQNEARARGSGLRLKLRLDSPELINIPWEFLYDASLGRFLGLFEDSPIVRYIEVRERVQPLTVTPPLSVLVMVTSPSDYPLLDVAREKANLQEALGDLIRAGLLTLTWVEKATLATLAEMMLRRRYHIFYYIGHGGFNEQSKDGILVLEDEQGQGQWVSGERLAYLLGNQPTLRLVILNACEGGRTASDDPFAGIAMTLVRTGSVPAVVAMQLAITDVAAIAFGRGFFNALSVGKPVDAAVTQARLAIFASGNDVEWGTPVLYMRSPDGRIFDVQSQSPKEAEALQRAVETAREEAELAEKAQAEALALQQQEAARIKALEERQVQLNNLYERAQVQMDEEDWAGADVTLKQIQEIQPDYLNVVVLLKQVQEGQDLTKRQAEEYQNRQEAETRARQQDEIRQAELVRLYAEADEAAKEGSWLKAIEIFEGVRKLDPGYRDALTLQRQARESLAQEEAIKQRQELLAQSYTRALEHFQAHRWQEATLAFQAVIEIDPSYSNPLYGNASDLMARAKQEKERSDMRPPIARFAKPTTLPEEIPRRGKPEDLPR
jgi:tetratricopeptide (TPR) repeat protein